jgi:hypothetical protein
LFYQKGLFVKPTYERRPARADGRVFYFIYYEFKHMNKANKIKLLCNKNVEAELPSFYPLNHGLK